MLSFYRTHASDLDSFFKNGMDVYYANTSKDVMCVILLINILRKNYTYTDRFFLLQYSLVHCIDQPTRNIDNSGSCLDYIFVRYGDTGSVRSAVVHLAITVLYSTATYPATSPKYNHPFYTYLQAATSLLGTRPELHQDK